jgi:hypothetical protein
MNAPKMRRVGEAYIYTWPAPDFAEIEIDQIHRERDAWHSWITVRTHAPGMDPHLSAGSLNLAATGSRASLARMLKERAPDVDWAGLLEAACVLTIRDERAGEPFKLVGSLPEREESPWTIEPLLRRRQSTISYGDGGTMKSTMALFHAALVSGGLEACGFTPHVTGPVAYLDWETDDYDIDDTPSSGPWTQPAKAPERATSSRSAARSQREVQACGCRAS